MSSRPLRVSLFCRRARISGDGLTMRCHSLLQAQTPCFLPYRGLRTSTCGSGAYISFSCLHAAHTEDTEQLLLHPLHEAHTCQILDASG